MRLLLVATLAALAVALPTGYHRKSSANFEDKLDDRDAERTYALRGKDRLYYEGRVRSKINQAVKLLEGVVEGKDWLLMAASRKKLKIKSVLDEAIQRLDAAAQELITEAPRFRHTDDLDYSAFAMDERAKRRAELFEDVRV